MVQALVLPSDRLTSQTFWLQPFHSSGGPPSWAQQGEQEGCSTHARWMRQGRAEQQGHATDFAACAASQLLPLHPLTSTEQKHCRSVRALFLLLAILLLSLT